MFPSKKRGSCKNKMCTCFYSKKYCLNRIICKNPVIISFILNLLHEDLSRLFNSLWAFIADRF